MTEYVIKGVAPVALAQYFEEISAIPRASGNESGIADYLVSFAKAHGFFCYRDETNNVFMKKPASAGKENAAPLLLQAHTDMVAEKNAGIKHDFEKDGIRLVQEGNILRADGTTLGADDGFGVAAILTLLASNEEHPALECLFTSSEETGMDGVIAFDYSHISSRTLLNFDSGVEQEILCGCCGGIRTDLCVDMTRKESAASGLRVKVTGLCGGHSGEDIHRGRGNALTVMASLLHAVREVCELRIAEVNGGDKSNAIPRECEAVIFAADENAARAAIERVAGEWKAQTVAEDSALEITVEAAACTATFDVADTDRILVLLSTTGGVMAWHPDMKDMPYTSRNVASVRTGDTCVCVVVSHRSFSMPEIEKSAAELAARAESIGGSSHEHNGYPGWESPLSSPLATAWQEAYTAVTGKHAHTAVVHAGLECGMIADHLPGLTAISVGPNIYDLHTPAERMELDSFTRFYATLIAFLKKA